MRTFLPAQRTCFKNSPVFVHFQVASAQPNLLPGDEGHDHHQHHHHSQVEIAQSFQESILRQFTVYTYGL